MVLSDKIAEIIKDPLLNIGYEVVKVTVSSGIDIVVDIFIDRFDSKPVSVNDCVEASRLLSPILDVEDIINGKYHLNISSPGEYRSIVSVADFERFCGRDAKLELFSPVDNKRKISGFLMNIEQNLNDIVVYLREECNTGDALIGIAYNNIKKASIKRVFQK